jgi:hypothetical protein
VFIGEKYGIKSISKDSYWTVVKAQLFGQAGGLAFELEKNINRISAIWKIKKKTRERGCDYELDFFFLYQKNEAF